MTGRALSFVIRSRYADSGEALRIDIDSDLSYRVADGDRGVRIFTPLVDVARLDEPSIIDSF